MIDDSLSEEEINGLRHFLLEFSDLLYDWPYSFLLAKVNSILEDDFISKDEIRDLEQTVRDFLGNTLQNTGAVTGLSTILPIDKNVLVSFEQKSFCFTGQFRCGKRKTCHSITEERGGLIKSSVVMDLDYLVLGELASRDWIETNYGRKIQKAMDLREKKCSNIAVISETDWMSALKLN
jgi:NAD-dependent DNA ligase